MEVEETESNTDSGIDEVWTGQPEIAEKMIEFLCKSNTAYFKSQQNNEPELTIQQKREILEDVLKNHARFLQRYGKDLVNTAFLRFFESQTYPDDQNYEIQYYLKEIKQNNANSNRVKNRRYAALQQMIKDDSDYFSENEMIARAPLLYHHMVGQYLTEADRRVRDTDANDTFVDIIFKNMDHDRIRNLQQQQEEEEEEDDSDKSTEILKQDEPMTFDDNMASCSRQHWGNFDDDSNVSQDGMCQRNFKEAAKNAMNPNPVVISEQEKDFLRDEFLGIMYSNFLSGQDQFDYSNVDYNAAYDDLELLNQDAEDKYFETDDVSESAEKEENVQKPGDGSSEDELDIYMKHLNQHIKVQEMTHSFQDLNKG
jgi:hypothetical protein